MVRRTCIVPTTSYSRNQLLRCLVTFNTLRTWLLNCLNARSRGLTFRHCASCTWSVRKVSDLWPGKRNWLTWSVGHLISLKVVPLGLHTLLPTVPPLLEACRKSLFWNGVYFGCRCCHNVLSCLNSGPFNGLLSLWNSQKSQGAISGE